MSAGEPSTETGTAGVLTRDVGLVAISLDRPIDAREVDELVHRGIGAVEVRLDLFEPLDVAAIDATLSALSAVPVITTVRSAAEGGRWTDDDASRARLYRAVLDRTTWIDLELADAAAYRAVIADAQRTGVGVILSFHDFETTPSTMALDELATRAATFGADVVKVATRTDTAEDLAALVAFTIARRSIDVIAVGMGTFGPMSRVMLPLMGSKVTFAATDRCSVPGQLGLDDTVELMTRLATANSPQT
ncbi:MAG: type I 3-dehydroquinate dehydratase [Microthrixaceae bacterium]